ncbi:DUF2335 domain-containing protein [Candidatus Bipolaricaulota bacterium]|nr:DUF2335 domain-containing protein [Candidatus Bipolaricaulota bacterium]
MPSKAKDEPKQPTDSEKPSAEKDSSTGDNFGLDVLKEIEEEEPDLLEPLSPKNRERLGYLLATRVVSKIYRGPLPPPEDIAAYNNHIPDGANRIMCMAEEALKSRIKIGESSLKAQIKQSGRGQMFGLLIGLFGIATGAIVTLMGCEVVGGIIAGFTVVSIATAFITGQKRQRASSPQQRNTN